MQTLSFPFRVDPGGHVATVTQGSDEHTAELVAHLLLTRKGERVLVPDFGITDPVFRDLDAAELQVTVETFGPERTRVRIISQQQVDERTVAYAVAIERS